MPQPPRQLTCISSSDVEKSAFHLGSLPGSAIRTQRTSPGPFRAGYRGTPHLLVVRTSLAPVYGRPLAEPRELDMRFHQANSKS